MIGIAAIDSSDAYEKANAVPPEQSKVRDPRRVEHSQIINPEDIPRFAKLGIIPQCSRRTDRRLHLRKPALLERLGLIPGPA